MDVALVCVGDELLAGDTVNTNAAWLGRRLDDRGDVGLPVGDNHDPLDVHAPVVQASPEPRGVRVDGVAGQQLVADAH